MKIFCAYLLALIFIFASVVIFVRGGNADKPAVASADAPKTQANAWLVRCDKSKDPGAQHCEAFQNIGIQQKKTGKVQRIVELAVGYPQKGKKAQAVIILPLGILMQEKILVDIDGKGELKAELRYCQADGCFAFTEISDHGIRKLSEGKEIMVKGKLMNGQDLHVVMGLQGFAAAIAKVQG